MSSYDKAEYHDETVADLGLPAEHAANHTLFFLRWLMERGLTSDLFESGGAEVLRAYRAGEASLHDVYGTFDDCLHEDMLSDEGNAFARHYFDFAGGEYLADYGRVLQRDLPSQYHVAFTEENYRMIRPVIDERHAAWRRNPAAPAAPDAPAAPAERGLWSRVRDLLRPPRSPWS